MSTGTTHDIDKHSIWEFRLYVSGKNHESKMVESRLRQLCTHFLGSHYKIYVIDIMGKDSDLPDNLLAVPTIVRSHPLPERRVIGDLAATDRAVTGLGLDQLSDII